MKSTQYMPSKHRGSRKVKAYKRMSRPHRLEDGSAGYEKIMAFLDRGVRLNRR